MTPDRFLVDRVFSFLEYRSVRSFNLRSNKQEDESIAGGRRQFTIKMQ